MFFGTAPDTECATLPATARAANIGSCIGNYTKLDHCNSVLAGTAGYLQNQLQSVLNAVARLIFFSRRASEHTTPLLWDLHCLSVPERIQFRLCVLAYHCVHGTAPAYLADRLRPTSEFVARRHLRSADTTTLLVPPTRRVTLGDHAFPVAAAQAWNSLPAQIRAASSLLSFRRQTKAHLFQL